MRTANPALNKSTFGDFSGVTGYTSAMTIGGTVNKTLVLLSLLTISALQVWNLFFKTGNPRAVVPWMLGGITGGLIVAFITIFNKKTAYITAPLYAVLEGLALGGISAFFEARYPGIVIQAVGLTFGTLFSLLLLYKSGIIKATENFKLGVAAATGSIFLVYFVTFILGIFGINVPYIHGGGTVGILFSFFVVGIAAMNLVLDFDFIENGAENGAEKYMEWYAAFGLMVTLVWLYIEILRLLAKLQQRK